LPRTLPGSKTWQNKIPGNQDLAFLALRALGLPAPGFPDDGAAPREANFFRPRGDSQAAGGAGREAQGQGPQGGAMPQARSEA